MTIVDMIFALRGSNWGSPHVAELIRSGTATFDEVETKPLANDFDRAIHETFIVQKYAGTVNVRENILPDG
jgi:hypothetical protein